MCGLSNEYHTDLRLSLSLSVYPCIRFRIGKIHLKIDVTGEK